MTATPLRTIRLTGVLNAVLLLTGLAAGAQTKPPANPFAACALPSRFTATYTVRSRDVRTEAMRQSEMQSYLDYWHRMVEAGRKKASELPQLEESTRKEYLPVTPPAEYTLTLSCDGSRLFCLCKSKIGDDFTLAVYDAATKQTACLEKSTWTGGHPEAETLPGFNYARLRLVPLLAFQNEKLGLFLCKDPTPTTPETTIAGETVWRGQSPLTLDANGVRIAEIPYQPSEVTLAKTEGAVLPRRVVQYYQPNAASKEINRDILNDWDYSRYVPMAGAPGTKLPGIMTYRDYKGFELDGARKVLPKTEYQYTLVSAQAKPLESARFEVQTWVAEREQATQATRQNVDVSEQSPVYTAPPIANTDGSKAHDLTGTVTDADSKPLSGATVYVYEAAQRVGTSPFCPSCYVDCGKQDTSGANGGFHIPSLSNALIFRLLVLREGYAPSYVNGVDALRGKISVALSKLPPTPNAPKHIVAGFVVDPTGQPVAGAAVELIGLSHGNGGMFGEIPGMEPMTITNARGAFQFHCPEPDSKIYVRIKARGLAPVVVPNLSTGTPQPHRIALTLGATVAGIVQDNTGRKLAGVTVEIVPVDRNTETFVGWFTIGTNAEGCYSLPNLPVGRQYAVCARMEGLAAQNLGGQRAFVTPAKDGTTTDNVNMNMNPAATLTGRVVLADGKSLPANTRLMLGREGTWDVQQAVLAADGGFTFRGVPQDEELTFDVYVSGYHTAETTPGYNKIWREARMRVPKGTLQQTAVTLTLDPDKPAKTARK